MTNKENRRSKFLPIETKKNLKEISPILSEDEWLEMNYTLFDCYSKNKAIMISYYENGAFQNYSGVIAKIDILNKQLTLLPKKKFDIQYISKIVVKS